MEKGPQSNESYEREKPRNRTISTVLWVHRKLPQSTVKLVLPSNESYESKTGCNRTLATVLWVPLNCFSSEVSKRGWREGVGDQERPKYSKKSPPKVCSPTHKGHRKKGAEKRLEFMALEGFPYANHICPPTPFRNLIVFCFFSGQRKNQ